MKWWSKRLAKAWSVIEVRHAKNRASMIGKSFGRWTVLELSVQFQRTYCKCRCACDGRIRWVTASSLRNGLSQSCGCLKSERTSCAKRKPIPKGNYGSYIVLGSLVINQQSWSRCKCQCGNIFEARNNDLRTGRTSSCGCARRIAVRETWNDPAFRLRHCVATREISCGRSNAERSCSSKRPIELTL